MHPDASHGSTAGGSTGSRSAPRRRCHGSAAGRADSGGAARDQVGSGSDAVARPHAGSGSAVGADRPASDAAAHPASVAERDHAPSEAAGRDQVESDPPAAARRNPTPTDAADPPAVHRPARPALARTRRLRQPRPDHLRPARRRPARTTPGAAPDTGSSSSSARRLPTYPAPAGVHRPLGGVVRQRTRADRAQIPPAGLRPPTTTGGRRLHLVVVGRGMPATAVRPAHPDSSAHRGRYVSTGSSWPRSIARRRLAVR
ncbi:hypothetical protein V2I01_13225 [Micromonospora sp. BRA006-A]|nr:hypothetical protein [Micromonospora sp. BRA006-A]